MPMALRRLTSQTVSRVLVLVVLDSKQSNVNAAERHSKLDAVHRVVAVIGL